MFKDLEIIVESLKPHYPRLFVFSDSRPVVKSVRRAGSPPLMLKYWDPAAASPHQHPNQVTHIHTHTHFCQVKARGGEVE